MMTPNTLRLPFSLVALLLAACATTQPHAAAEGAAVSPTARAAAEAAVAAPDRSADDRALDPGRRSAETLAFFGLEPGMRVAEIGAGGGYSSELMARIVGPKGVVYGQNAPFVLKRFAEKPWSERLAKPVNANVRRLDAPFDAPFPADFADQGKLDAVINILFYHDTVWQEVDRAAMNAAIFAALRSGGVYGIVDHSARPEDGITVTQTYHRIAEQAVIDEITAAGFVLEARSEHLRNPSDTRDWNDAPGAAGDRRGTSDRFVLRFRKP